MTGMVFSRFSARRINAARVGRGTGLELSDSAVLHWCNDSRSLLVTGKASSLWDYEENNDPLPAVGEYGIVLDGAGESRAIIQVQNVQVVPFNAVGESHAYAEGEGDRTVEYWRESHEHFWRNYSENARGFEPDMPIVCERFSVLFAM